MKTVVLDDDPTGTQSAHGVDVLLSWDATRLAQALRRTGAVYLQTNSRALAEADAITLAKRIKEEVKQAEAAIGDQIRVVLRGDSTLRGHVFAETDIFVDEDSPILFLPAFPDGGRTTKNGIHYVSVDGLDTPAHETEYAADPVFPFRHSDLVSYVKALGSRDAVTVPLAQVRESEGRAVTEALLQAPGRSVVAPDATTDEDIDLVHAGLEAAIRAGRRVVVRCASPLAARCAGAASPGLLPHPIQRCPGPILFVCGSHTDGATRQLAALEKATGVAPAVIDTDHAFSDPIEAGRAIIGQARQNLSGTGLAIIASGRARRSADNTLDHGAKVMTALTTAVEALAEHAGVVVAKGGITSAEVAATGLGADQATVRGQILPGVSVWDLSTRNGACTYVVVPGNVGRPDTLVEIVGILTPH